MKTVLLVQPSLQPPGGGNGVGAWIIEALKRQHAVSVLTWTPIDLAPINRYYGTSLHASEFKVYGVHPLVRHVIDLVPMPFSLLKTHLLLRLVKRLQDAYDVIITANNEADFGCKGMQYVHFPWAYQPRPAVDLRWYHGSMAMVNAYYRLCLWISDFSFERMRQNLTLVNSDWTGSRVRECHGIASTTLYPPVSWGFPEVPWEDRENGFVCIGRMAPEKELEKVIGFLAAVRARGWDVHLHIIGTADIPDYSRRIVQLARGNATWLLLAENLSREELVRLVSAHRYGIHGMEHEPFGIAVAEMQQAGCIVFAPRSGGQVEILGGDERLLYSTSQEAVEKIVRVLSNAHVQTTLRTSLAARQTRFTVECFMARMQELVRQF
jgi:glycosyltransferase involved in cell wall biosynthesis